MTMDCGCCGETFQAEGDETNCLSCGGCTQSCANSPVMEILPQETLTETESISTSLPMSSNDGECYSFSELEYLLFSGEEGRKTLTRIITRMRVEGYDEEAWKVMIGLTAFAYKYYNCKGIAIHDQLKMLENAPLREVTQYMAGDITALTEQVMNAESLKPSLDKKNKESEKDAYKIIALGLTALAFAYATRG